MEREFEESNTNIDPIVENSNSSLETAVESEEQMTSYRLKKEDLVRDSEYNYENQGNTNQQFQSQGFENQYTQQNWQGQRKHPRLKKIVTYGSLCIAAVAVGIGSFYIKEHVLRRQNNSTQQGLPGNGQGSTAIDKNQNEKENSKKLNMEIASTTVKTENLEKDNEVVKVAESVMPSIVIINSTVEASYYGQVIEQQGSGSGIIIKQTDKELLVVTNNHVVEDAKKIGVTFVDEQSVEATVKGTDSVSDLAVISIPLDTVKKETLDKIKVATLGDSTTAKVGEMAVAIGNALGYGQSVTVGYVSAKDRTIDMSGTSMTLLQTDAAINPGNSGGALLNLKGEVIGINSVKFASDDVEGMGYAIPITTAVPIINDLMEREVLKTEEKGYLGISGTNVTQEEETNLGMPQGVFVKEISENGAAKDSGLQVNDIITAINDIKVTDISALAERVNSYRTGTVITLTVQRRVDGQYQEMKIEVTLKGKETLDSLTNGTTTDQQSESSQTPSTQEPGSSEDSSQSPYGNSDNYGNEFPWEFFR